MRSKFDIHFVSVNELQNGIERLVLLRLAIESRGTISALEFETYGGSEALDRAAMDAVLHWKFQPWSPLSGPSSQMI